MNEYNDNIDLREEKKSMAWLWIILGIIILIILAFIFGLFNKKEIETLQDQSDKIELIDKDSADFVKVDNLNIETLESFPVQSIVTVGGIFQDTCTIVSDISQFLDGNIFYIRLKSGKTEAVVCDEIETPYHEDIALETIGLEAGTYIVDVNGIQTEFTLDQDNVINWEAGEEK